MGILQNIVGFLQGLDIRREPQKAAEEKQLFRDLGIREETQPIREKALPIDKEKMLEEMYHPIPTIWDVLYEATGKPTFGKIAAFVRPQTEDIGGVSGPLAIGEMSVHAAKQLPKLLSAYYKGQQHALKPDIKQLLREEVPTRVHIPAAKFARGIIDKPLLETNVMAFVKALADLPKGALKPVNEALYSLYKTHMTGSYDPANRRITLYGTQFARPGKHVRIPQTIAHETTHAIADQEELYDSILDFLRATQWKFEKPTLRSKLAEYASQITERPQAYVPEYVANVKYAPPTYRELSRLGYEGGYPEWPIGAGPTVEVPMQWGGSLATGKLPYGTTHPIEDIAESGAYAMLEKSPYEQTFSREIEALRANPRYDVIRKLLREAGVELP